jgi:diacylglycerol kinase family enzyme
VNHRAGSLASLPDPRAALSAALAEAGYTLAPAPPEQAALEEQWRAAGTAGIVFVAGGDGTLRNAAARLAGTGRVLAPIPAGTMNRFATRLGLPPTPQAAIAAYRSATVHEIPLAEVNGEPFLHQCVVGRITWLMRLRERQRGTGMRGWWRMLRALLREALHPHLPRVLTARLGPASYAGLRRTRAHTAVVTAPSAAEPPLLCLKVAPRRDPRVLLRQAWRWFRGRLADDPDILVRYTTHLAIAATARTVRLSVDGEALRARTPLRFRLRPAALRVLVPTPPE